MSGDETPRVGQRPFMRLSFENKVAPGARSAWHTQPLGQALIVTEGTGWIQ